MAMSKKFNMDDIQFGNFDTEKVKEKPVIDTVKEKNETDKGIETESATEEKPSELSDAKISTDFIISAKKKERKTIHKNFLISEEMNEKFKKLAEQTGRSENSLFNEILEQILKINS